MTYREQFESALQCSSEKEARVWLEDEIARHKSEFGIEPEQAKKTILHSIGYMAGYYDHETAVKVHKLFGARHPVFGHPDYWKNLNADDCFRAGQALARAKRGNTQ